MTGAWRRFTARMEEVVRDVLRGDERARLPAGGAALWQVFCALCSARQSSGYGPQALALSEIATGALAAGVALEPRHVAVLQAMDRAWLAHAVKPPAPEGAAILPAVSKAPITAELFDIVV